MLNSINSLALDPNQELSLDDLDLVLGGGNAVSATGEGDDGQRQQQPLFNALDLRATPNPVSVTVSASSTEVHTGGEGPLQGLVDTLHEIGHEVVDLAHKGGEIIYDTVHPIGQALGQLGYDVIMAIDQQIVGSSPSSGTGH